MFLAVIKKNEPSSGQDFIYFFDDFAGRIIVPYNKCVFGTHGITFILGGTGVKKSLHELIARQCYTVQMTRALLSRWTTPQHFVAPG